MWIEENGNTQTASIKKGSILGKLKTNLYKELWILRVSPIPSLKLLYALERGVVETPIDHATVVQNLESSLFW